MGNYASDPLGSAEACQELKKWLPNQVVEKGRLLFISPTVFEMAVNELTQLPQSNVVEVAFAGRSNVGKSSLINAITGQLGIAHSSATPGRTRQLNFFSVDGRLRLVDMPGYGYAKASKNLKTSWQELMFNYLRGRSNLRRVLLLIDARIEQKKIDLAMMDLLDEAGVSFQIVLTKSDAVKPLSLEHKLKEAERLSRTHAAAYPIVLATSSRTHRGIAELRATIAELV